MTIVIKRRTLVLAEEVFNLLGSALQDIQIYTDQHPRFEDSCARIHEGVQECFARNRDFKRLTFTITDDAVLFQGIPLLNLAGSGQKLVHALKGMGSGGVQFRAGTTVDGVRDIVRDLFRLCKRQDAVETADLAALAGASEGRHVILSSRMAQHLAEGKDPDFSNFDEVLSQIQIPELRVSQNNMRSVLNTYRNLLSNLEDGRTFDYSLLSETSKHAIALFSANPDSAVQLATRDYFDDFTFHHSLNVCLLATTVASKVVKSAAQLNLISLAALLHDVGKSRIPAEILYKRDRLTHAEFDCLKTHPELGAEILMGIDGIHPLCITVAFGHHMHAGEGSYPVTGREYHFDWITELVAVVDVYEALTAVRPYKKGFSSQKAFEIMLEMPSVRDRLPILKLLYRSLGPYPVGTTVELETGERAVVVKANPAVPHLPKVKVMTDRELQLLDEPLEIDLYEEHRKDPDAERRIVRPVITDSPGDDPLKAELRPEPERVIAGSANDEALMEREG